MHDRPRRVDWAYGAAMLIPRAALEPIGGFDERFFFYAEDLEWCWRAHTLGWEIWFEPCAVVHHWRARRAQLYGGIRDARAHAQLAALLPPRARNAVRAAWWGLNAAGGAMRLASALRRRDRADATAWRRFVRAQVESVFVRERRPGPTAQEER